MAAAGLVTLMMRHHAERDVQSTETSAGRYSPTDLDSLRTPASSSIPDSTPSAEAVPRLARTWTKVHQRRSVNADVVAVLLPGDTVLADSLVGGWWRVALEGRVIGYVYAPTLVGQ
jgi:hypothetical protein